MNIANMVGLMAATTFASQAAAHELQFAYLQDLEGVYSQSWYSMPVDNPYEDKHEVFVRGEGKLGEFYGVLYVDCSAPQHSRWVAHGGWVETSAVPMPVIRVIRARVC